MILNPNNWDEMPEPLMHGEVMPTKNKLTTKEKYIAPMPWE